MQNAWNGNDKATAETAVQRETDVQLPAQCICLTVRLLDLHRICTGSAPDLIESSTSEDLMFAALDWLLHVYTDGSYNASSLPQSRS
jgi:hypothetical protein